MRTNTGSNPAEKNAFDIDCVVIGLNTASTLAQCIESVQKSTYSKGNIFVYYVDGGSTDDSVKVAKKFKDITVIETRIENPTPGFGRNRGWQAGQSPFVQFLDSDTIIDPRWLDVAVTAFTGETGAVKGGLEEMHPESSVYNWIGSLEWDSPAGECESFGGNVMVKRQVLNETGGYDEVMVAGEDPELSQRVRLLKWKILHVNAPMAGHDLAMTKVSQYLSRCFRTGYGFAAVALKHAANAKGFWIYETVRICIRGGLPLLLTAAALTGGYVNINFLIMLLPAFLLLFYPRLFRVSYFIRDKNLSVEKAKVYALHCSFAVIPQFLGILRYILGKAAGRPLRNRRRVVKGRLSPAAWSIISLAVFSTLSCATIEPVTDKALPDISKNAVTFDTELQKVKRQYVSPGALEEISKDMTQIYHLGPGDIINLQVWQRPDISDDEIIVGPDGVITVARIGNINVSNRDREDVTAEITAKLSRLYEHPEVSLSIKEYKNNKAFVLGRVGEPGVVIFPGRGTLLEAISLAGGRAVLDEEALPNKCAIIRGNDTIIWVDLKELLENGNIGLNARIQNNDVVYVPESEASLAYVMGEVTKPGAIRLKGNMSFMDALMMSGGPTRDADLEETYLIRFDGEHGSVKAIDVKSMIEKGALSDNFLLRDNDIVYVLPTGMSDFNYAMEQITPFLRVMSMSTSVLETFGVMPEFRKQVWDQEGFVGD